MKLAVLRGFQNKNDVTISSVPYDIGRCRSADFVIAHVNVSRNHCKIIRENKLWKISDFSSSGTYVNDALVGKGKTVIINNGDSIRFGPLENNLCWIFNSFDSPCENHTGLGVQVPRTQVVLSLHNEKCLDETNVPGKPTSLEPGENGVCKNYESTGETRLREQKIDDDHLKVIKELENAKTCTDFAKEETVREESESKKIEELTKELEEVQTALNVLEKKNCALQVELATGATSKTEITDTTTTNTTNVLENLTDLMETEFQCTICSELFVTALTLGCMHTFCKYCIDQWKKKQKTCPICRKKITNETRSLVVDNYIDKVVGNLSAELKERREAIIKERNQTEPCKKRTKKR